MKTSPVIKRQGQALGCKERTQQNRAQGQPSLEPGLECYLQHIKHHIRWGDGAKTVCAVLRAPTKPTPSVNGKRSLREAETPSINQRLFVNYKSLAVWLVFSF